MYWLSWWLVHDVCLKHDRITNDRQISISLCVYAPHNDALVVLTSFTNNGGWPSMALSVMIGQSTALYACGNPDAVAYLSDEAQVHLIPFLAAAKRLQ